MDGSTLPENISFGVGMCWEGTSVQTSLVSCADLGLDRLVAGCTQIDGGVSNGLGWARFGFQDGFEGIIRTSLFSNPGTSNLLPGIIQDGTRVTHL